jgi:succinate dehydrogenase / fumarate reductase cytochrome b subunit
MRRALNLYQSSVGKKIVMAVTGTLLFLFVLVHMLGNMKIYMGAVAFNEYAAFLREVGHPALPHGALLWIFRLGLLGAVGLHVLSATQLYLVSRRARRTGYKLNEDLSFSYASSTMRWGGVILALFVVYHLLHLTLGVDPVHPRFEHGAAYANVVNGFRVWYVSAIYICCMLPLGLHIYHGLWSATQTLALQHRSVKKWRRPFAAGVAGLIVLGNISIPVSVLIGLVR